MVYTFQFVAFNPKWGTAVTFTHMHLKGEIHIALVHKLQ